MDDKKPFEFNIIGLPTNDDIDVEDEKPVSRTREKSLPPDIEKMIKDMFGNSDLIRMSEEIEKNMSPKELADMEKSLYEMLKMMGLDPNIIKSYTEDTSDDDEEDNDGSSEGEPKTIFELGKINYLFKEGSFKQILIQSDPDLYLSFIEKYGNGPYSTNIFFNHDNNWTINAAHPIPLNKITELSVIDHNNNYILLYGTSDDETEQGIFLAITKDTNGEFQIVIPEYGNTYDLIKDDEIPEDEMYVENPEICKLYSSKATELFTKDGKFIFLDIDKVEAGLNMLLTVKNHPLISPKDFGQLIQIRSSVDVQDYSKMLRIGTIKANDSSATLLLKRDFDIPEDKKTFDFYLRFTDTVSGIILNQLADYFNSLNLNDSQLLENSELKVIGRGDKLYIDFDLGNIPDNLMKWIPDKGNSEF